MSSERAEGAVGRGLSHHGAVHRVAGGAVLDEGAAAAVAGGPVRLWTESVTGPSDGSVAERRRAAELHAPLAGAAVRAIVLAYEDGVREVVLAGGPGLGAVAAALLGDAGAVPAAGTAPALLPPDGSLAALPVALPEAVAGTDLAADLAAALALVLARSCAAQRPALDVHVEGMAEGYTTALPDEDDEDRTVLEYRARAARHPGAIAPDTGGIRFALRVDRAPRGAGQTHRLPALDVRHAMTVSVHAAEGTATAWYRPQDVPAWRAEILVRQLATALVELTSGDPDRRLAGVEVTAAPERRRILELGSTPRTGRRRAGTLHEQVLGRAFADPHAIALVDGDTSVTYRRLARRAGRLANALRELGVAPGDRVGVCLDRGSDLVVVLLAVLAAGAVYVPLDPTGPADRLTYIARDAGLSLVLVTAGNADATPFGACTAVPLDRLEELAEGAPEEPPACGTGPDDPAYVIYTSGSTGQPKGVVVPHRNVSDLLSATESDFGFGPGDVWSWFHSAAFDFSVWEIWGCLLTGGRLVVVPYWTCRSPEDFRELLLKERVTVLSQTPSAFARLLELERGAGNSPLDVRLVVFGGEPLDARSLTPWFDAHPESRCRVVNMFGITETTVHVTAQTVTRTEALAASRSVGRAIPGWSVRVLDGRGRLLPPGSPGEIAVAGDGVALEYLNQPELTSRRFVADPDGAGRLYLSGDLGVLLPDGRLEHLGRLDDQVKVRGYRIELGEIRNVLLTHGAVVAAAVVLGRDASGDVCLDAYAVLDGADPAEVRRHAARVLPEYMMPATLTHVESLPLTVNGKVDTARLPAPQPPAPVTAPRAPAPAADRGTQAPPAAQATRSGADPVLDSVLEVWRELFHAEVGPDEDFFHLGGNSLLALRIVRLLKDRGLAVGVREVYRLRTPAGLARFSAGQ